jgi:hypothetical protein
LNALKKDSKVDTDEMNNKVALKKLIEKLEDDLLMLKQRAFIEGKTNEDLLLQQERS